MLSGEHIQCGGKNHFNDWSQLWLVKIVAQLVEQSLAIPEVHGSSPVIGKIYSEHLFTVNCIEKMNIQKKKPGMAHFYKIQKLTTYWEQRIFLFGIILSSQSNHHKKEEITSYSPIQL